MAERALLKVVCELPRWAGAKVCRKALWCSAQGLGGRHTPGCPPQLCLQSRGWVAPGAGWDHRVSDTGGAQHRTLSTILLGSSKSHVRVPATRGPTKAMCPWVSNIPSPPPGHWQQSWKTFKWPGKWKQNKPPKKRFSVQTSWRPLSTFHFFGR